MRNGQSDAKKVHWSIGNAHFIYDLAKAEAFADSVATAKKEQEKVEKEKSEEEKATDKKSDDKKEEASFKPVEFRVEIKVKKDIPKGTALLKGARIVTMKGNEVIENGDILIENARIKAIGASGTLVRTSWG